VSLIDRLPHAHHSPSQVYVLPAQGQELAYSKPGQGQEPSDP